MFHRKNVSSLKSLKELKSKISSRQSPANSNLNSPKKQGFLKYDLQKIHLDNQQQSQHSKQVTVRKNFQIKNLNRKSESQIKFNFQSPARKVSKSLTKVKILNQIAQNKKDDIDYEYLNIVGIGGFGKVWKVSQHGQLFAMKEMSKALIIAKKSVNSVMNEKNLLSELKHKFLVNMQNTFSNHESLFLVMDYVGGGDLRYHLGKKKRFSEEETKFFISCLVVAVEYLHSKGIIHRDIKPENLVLDKDGYLKLTDLGVARKYRPDNSTDTSGTPGYMAPEVICRQNHGFGVDYFAIGVILYECILGRRPYIGRSRAEIKEAILANQVQLKKEELPPGWSEDVIELVNGLLERNPLTRTNNIKKSKWLKNFNWNKLVNYQLQGYYIPKSGENYDKRQIEYEDRENQLIIEGNKHVLNHKITQDMFKGY